MHLITDVINGIKEISNLMAHFGNVTLQQEKQ